MKDWIELLLIYFSPIGGIIAGLIFIFNNDNIFAIILIVCCACELPLGSIIAVKRILEDKKIGI